MVLYEEISVFRNNDPTNVTCKFLSFFFLTISLTVGIPHIPRCLEKMAFSLFVTMTDMLQQHLHGKKSLTALTEGFTG